jgi:hypothetical protein
MFATNPKERAFEEELEIFRTEVEQAKQFFYAHLGINAEARENESVFQTLNQTALLWNTIQYALQKSTFIALSRIFDPNPNVHGVSRLLQLAQKHLDMFSRAALALRKPDAPPSFAAEAHEPTPKDFRQLRKDTRVWRGIYEQRYAPLIGFAARRRCAAVR